MLTSFQKTAKKRGANRSSSQAVQLVDGDHVAPSVLAARLAGVVGHNIFAAVRALHERGSRELPVGRASLITSLSGHFSFRDCHVDTSSSDRCCEQLSIFIIQQLLQYSHSWIAWFFAAAGAIVEILSTLRAEPGTVLTAEELGIHIQNE